VRCSSAHPLFLSRKRLLLFLFSAFALEWISGRDSLAGVLVALAACLKIFPLFLLMTSTGRRQAERVGGTKRQCVVLPRAGKCMDL